MLARVYDFFRGTVVALDTAGNLCLEVQGVGYRLRVSEQTRGRLPLDGSSVVVFARLAVREDDLALYGFADPAERAAFDLLTGVQGVGPAAAMGVLSAYGVGELRQLLARKEAAAFRKVKGIGAKTADRIALELHDKVERIPAPAAELPADERGGEDAASDEARQALVALGFSNREAARAVAEVAEPGVAGEELLRRALGLLR